MRTFGGVLAVAGAISGGLGMLIFFASGGRPNFYNGDGQWVVGLIGMSVMLALWAIVCGIYGKRPT